MSDAAEGNKAHLFGDARQAEAYKQYRPRYPPELFQAIYDYAGSAPTEIALDVATGSGQAAEELAKRYARVIAQDASPAQLAAAGSLSSAVQFQQATAEATGLPDASVDLVTVAQALHWFDLQKFYTEAHRVLQPGGTLAVWGYDLCRLNDEDADPVLQKLYSETLGPYWDERRRLIETHYDGLEPSQPGQFEDVQRWNMDVPTPMTVGKLLGTISSWSSYNTYRKQHPNKPDPLMMFHGQLKEALEFEGTAGHAFELDDVVYPVFMILARKPL